MPEHWGRPTWPIEDEPDPLVPWLFWIAVGFAVGGIVGYVAWKIWR